MFYYIKFFVWANIKGIKAITIIIITIIKGIKGIKIIIIKIIKGIKGWNQSNAADKVLCIRIFILILMENCLSIQSL